MTAQLEKHNWLVSEISLQAVAPITSTATMTRLSTPQLGCWTVSQKLKTSETEAITQFIISSLRELSVQPHQQQWCTCTMIKVLKTDSSLNPQQFITTITITTNINTTFLPSSKTPESKQFRTSKNLINLPSQKEAKALIEFPDRWTSPLKTKT